MSPVPLVRQDVGQSVYRHVRDAIESGDLKPGQMVASARQLEQSLGVSHHAAVKGMSQLAREGWVIRRSGQGTFVQDPDGRKMGAYPRTVALVTGEHLQEQYFLNPLLDAAGRELAAGGHAVRREHHGDEPAAIPPGGITADCAIWAKTSILPEVTLPPGPPFVIACHLFRSTILSDAPCDVVTIDQVQGGVLAGKHLRQSGCRKAVFLGVQGNWPGGWDNISNQRLRGFEAGWGRQLREEELFRTDVYRVVRGLEMARRVLFAGGELPLGVFAASDDLAMGLAHGAVAHGIALGGDIRLVGFDGQKPRYPEDPLLTTVEVPLEEMGRTAVRMALERAARPEMLSRRLSLGCALRRGRTA